MFAHTDKFIQLLKLNKELKGNIKEQLALKPDIYSKKINNVLAWKEIEARIIYTTIYYSSNFIANKLNENNFMTLEKEEHKIELLENEYK